MAALIISIAGCEGPTGPPGTGPESLTDPAVIPRVIYAYPPDGGVGPFPELYQPDCGYYAGDCYQNPRFQVRFNKIMDVATVRRSLRVSSTSGRLSTTPAGILPVGGDIFIVQPTEASGQRVRDYLPIGERCTITVDTSVRDINGNRPAAPVSVSFVPEPQFRVTGTYPPDGSSLDGLWATIRISFNAGFDSSMMNAVTVSPAVPAPSWYFTAPHSLQASIQLKGSTLYTVTVDTTAADLAGHHLSAPFQWSFQSIPFKVTSIYPSDGATGVSPQTSLQFSFSEPIDTATFRGAVRFTPPVDYHMYSWDGQYVTVSPDLPLAPNTAYLVEADSTLTSAGGSRLTSGFRSTFTTGPAPKFEVAYIYPFDGEQETNSWTLIDIVMNQPIDSMSVPGAFHIDPPQPGGFHFSPGSSGFLFIPSSQFRMGGMFTVSLDTTLRSTSGGTLTEPYRFSFTVQRFRISSVMPQDGRTDVAPTSPLTVTFNGTIDTTTLPGAVSIDPATPGRFSYDRYGFRFDPADTWTPETTYTIRIDTSLVAEGGGGLSEPFISTFRTAPFTIIQYSPPNGITNQPVDYPVWIYCNDDIDTGTVRTSFTMTDSAGNGVAGRFFFSDSYPARFVFLQYEPLTPGAPYRVVVTTGLHSVHGYPIKQDLIISFRTAP